ncbi:hypothetical protein ACL02T_31735 [Pseudonocardia sp. RS010]|uniref:hypothetical protein n=1 Tax=Pseudonocardia sp. RS010 TaxID=3385979 RepID=UPI0039A1E4EC
MARVADRLRPLNPADEAEPAEQSGPDERSTPPQGRRGRRTITFGTVVGSVGSVAGSAARQVRQIATAPIRAAAARPETTRRRLFVTAVVGVVLAGALTVFWWWSGRVDDQRATAVAETTRSVEELLSFDYRDADIDGRLALVAPEFRDRYASSVRDTVTPAANAQSSVVRTRVADTAVVAESRGEVTLLLFLDRTETSAAAPQPVLSGGRVQVSATESDGHWLVREITTI